jgi:hypothetical protein
VLRPGTPLRGGAARAERVPHGREIEGARSARAGPEWAVPHRRTYGTQHRYGSPGQTPVTVRWLPGATTHSPEGVLGFRAVRELTSRRRGPDALHRLSTARAQATSPYRAASQRSKARVALLSYSPSHDELSRVSWTPLRSRAEARASIAPMATPASYCIVRRALEPRPRAARRCRRARRPRRGSRQTGSEALRHWT